MQYVGEPRQSDRAVKSFCSNGIYFEPLFPEDTHLKGYLGILTESKAARC